MADSLFSQSLASLRLEQIDSSSHHTFLQPTKRINVASDISYFLQTKAFDSLVTFILQLNRALCPWKSQSDGALQIFSLSAERHDSNTVVQIRKLVERVGGFIEEAPPDLGPRRFGNISFRKWHKLLEARTNELLREHLPCAAINSENSDAFISEIRAYFLGGFGSPQRLDYGTGHELSFLAFLGCLWKTGVFHNAHSSSDGDIERSIVLGIIEPYLLVIRRLIITYTLEPAGSHGVWGLDDHFFLPYIFGSAQLTSPVGASDPMPVEGSVPGAPQPDEIIKPAIVQAQRTENLYFSAISFINDVKIGPFWEHSAVLFDISAIRNGWGKINKGMIKMFIAEVLSKFPVVQHFPFGSLFPWALDPSAPSSLQVTPDLLRQPTIGVSSMRTPALVGPCVPGSESSAVYRPQLQTAGTIPPIPCLGPQIPAAASYAAPSPYSHSQRASVGVSRLATQTPPSHFSPGTNHEIDLESLTPWPDGLPHDIPDPTSNHRGTKAPWA